jgi:hypothetical protein
MLSTECGGQPMTPANMMKEIVAAFAKADLQPLFDAVDEMIVWKSASNVEGFFRFSGEYRGRVGVVELTSNVATAYTFDHIVPKEIVSSGDVVWGLFDVEGGYQPQGKGIRKRVKFECAIRWRIENRKIVEHQSFFDTASLLVQQGEVERPS